MHTSSHAEEKKKLPFFSSNVHRRTPNGESFGADERGRVCYVMHWYTKCSVERGLAFSRGENNETVRVTENDNDRKREIVSSL